MSKELYKTREIRKREYALCCPECGKFQFRVWGEGGTSFQCERCKTCVVVTFMNGQFTVHDTNSEETNRFPRMKMAVGASY